MAALTRSAWIKLYKDLQRAAQQFPQFGYRNFARRRIREYFESNRQITNSQKLEGLYKEGQENLNIIQRQTLISNLYPNRKLVIEADKQ